MASATTTGLITAEEFFRMSDPADGSRQELVKGVIVTMPPPGGLHGACCSRVDRKIGNHADENKLGTVFTNDTGFVSERDPDSVLGPDVAFWSKERLPTVPSGYIEVPPDLAVEVISPHDVFTKVQKKVRQFLERGVRLIWIVDPEDRSVTVYKTQKESVILNENDTLGGNDVLPGFSCLVRDLLP